MPGDFTVHQRVRFQGNEYWWHEDTLAPIEHYDAEGNLLACPLRDLAYAVITAEGEIKRYHQVIGTYRDLEFI